MVGNIGEPNLSELFPGYLSGDSSVNYVPLGTGQINVGSDSMLTESRPREHPWFAQLQNDISQVLAGAESALQQYISNLPKSLQHKWQKFYSSTKSQKIDSFSGIMKYAFIVSAIDILSGGKSDSSTNSHVKASYRALQILCIYIVNNYIAEPLADAKDSVIAKNIGVCLQALLDVSEQLVVTYAYLISPFSIFFGAEFSRAAANDLREHTIGDPRVFLSLLAIFSVGKMYLDKSVDDNSAVVAAYLQNSDAAVGSEFSDELSRQLQLKDLKTRPVVSHALLGWDMLGITTQFMSLCMHFVPDFSDGIPVADLDPKDAGFPLELYGVLLGAGFILSIVLARLCAKEDSKFTAEQLMSLWNINNTVWSVFVWMQLLILPFQLTGVLTDTQLGTESSQNIVMIFEAVLLLVAVIGHGCAKYQQASLSHSEHAEQVTALLQDPLMQKVMDNLSAKSSTAGTSATGGVVAQRSVEVQAFIYCLRDAGVSTEYIDNVERLEKFFNGDLFNLYCEQFNAQLLSVIDIIKEIDQLTAAGEVSSGENLEKLGGLKLELEQHPLSALFAQADSSSDGDLESGQNLLLAKFESLSSEISELSGQDSQGVTTLAVKAVHRSKGVVPVRQGPPGATTFLEIGEMWQHHPVKPVGLTDLTVTGTEIELIQQEELARL